MTTMTAGDHQAFLAACGTGDLEKVKVFLAAGLPAYHQEEEGGTSLLMHAAKGAHLEVVQALLEAGAPWMALDRQGKCAGEYAMASEVEDAERKQSVIDTLVNHAVMAEMILGTMQNQAAEAVRKEQQQESAQYLGGNVRYEKDRLVDETEEGVMMEWEAPLMEAHASLLCGEAKNRDVMNVGFGMGIIDEAIQRHGCRSHTILEAHPTVLEKMEAEGWTQKAGVTVERGRWQETLPRLVAAGKKYDALFFDTYAEHYRDMQAFHEWLPKLLRLGGMYSFFNGLCPDNLFFHAVTCQLVKLELEALNFVVNFATVEVEGGAAKEGTWEGLRRKYWHGREEYYLPVAIFQGKGADVGKDEMEPARGETPRENSTNDNETADDTLVGEAQVGEEKTVEVLLHAALDPEAGGLTWRPYPDMRGRLDNVCLLQLRCWFPPMLHDAHRHTIFRRAIQGAVHKVQRQDSRQLLLQQQQQQRGQERGGREVRALDIGTGTSLLSLEAVRAGVTHVVACEGFPALAAVAQEVVRFAGMEKQIDVLSKRSTALEKEETGSIDLVVSELLDSTLLGEGYLSTLRDLYTRGLVSPNACVVPARARVWAQLIECPELPSHFHIPTANVACAGGGRPLPLYLAPPTNGPAAGSSTAVAETGSERKRVRSDTDDATAATTGDAKTQKQGFAGGHIPCIAVSAPFSLLDIDFAAVTSETSPGADVRNGPIQMGLPLTVPVLRKGTLHGVLMWWDLIPLDKTEVYTSMPRNPSTDPLWQDHWKPCVWPLATPRAVDATQTIPVQGAHDDQTMWVEVGGDDMDQSARRLREGPSPCICGLHASLPVGRVLELNDTSRLDTYRLAMQQVLGERKDDVCTILDICDGGLVVSCLLDIRRDLGGEHPICPPSSKLVSLEQHPWYAAVLERSCRSGGGTNCSSAQNNDAADTQLAVWRGAGAGEGWNSAAWGEDVHVLCGDGYYAKVGPNRPVWSWLNFWLLRTALAPVLARDVVVLPFQARLMAAVVECPSLYRVHGGGRPVADDDLLGGWNHDAYRRAVEEGAARAMCDEDRDLPVSLANHPHRFLTPPALVMRLDLHHAIDWTAPRAEDGAYRRNVIHVPFEQAGCVHALALWVDVDLTYGAATGSDPSLVVSGCETRHARQTLRWLSGEKVGQGEEGGKRWGVEIKAAMDLAETPGIWTECRIMERGGGDGGGKNGEDERD